MIRMEKKITNKKWHKCKDCGGRIYDHRPETHVCTPGAKKMSIGQYKEVLKEADKQIPTMPEITEDTKFHKKKSTMTIKETKLGVTMVLSKEDCKTLGFYEDAPTKQVIKWTREKLGLPEKKRGGK